MWREVKVGGGEVEDSEGGVMGVWILRCGVVSAGGGGGGGGGGGMNDGCDGMAG